MANCIIAQSGGPTAVINSSVVGLVEANKTLGAFDKVYAGLNGIEGILNGNIIELSSFSQDCAMIQFAIKILSFKVQIN